MNNERIRDRLLESMSKKMKFRGATKDNFRNACELSGMVQAASIALNVPPERVMNMIEEKTYEELER